MNPKLSVILPTFNEAENIIELIKRILGSSNCETEIIVVDDNSPDKTWELVYRMRKKNVKCIRRLGERGLATALIRGINESKANLIMWMDADLSMPPEIIPQFVKALENHDVVVGSRYVKGAKDKRPHIRVITSRMMNLFANIILNFKIKDYDSGFVAIRRAVFNKVKFNPKGYGEYCIEFLFNCTRKGFKVKEIPYVFTDREKGQSKTSEHFYSLLVHGFGYAWRIIALRSKWKN